MKTTTKIIFGAVIVLEVFGLGWYLHQPSQYAVGAVANGATNNNASIAEQSISNSATTTVFSWFNGNDNDVIVNDVSFHLQNISSPTTDNNTAGYSLSCSTSSLPYGGTVVSNNNYLLNVNTFAVAGTTTFPGTYTSTTSPGITGATGTTAAFSLATTTRIVAASSWLVCSSSPTFNSGITGYIRFGITRQ